MLRPLDWKRMIALALLLYLISLIWNLPASFVWERVKDQLPAQVELHGLTGTIWSGRVNRIDVDGIDQGALRWSWRPVGLLTAAIELDLGWTPRKGDVRATLQVGTDTLTLENVRGRLDAAAMASVNKAPFLLEGTWLLDVPVLELEDMEHVAQAEGRLVWEAAAGGLPTALSLGDLVADLQENDGWLQFSLSDQGGPLGLQGDARWRPGQAMELDTRLQARATAEAGLAGGLALLGNPAADGWISWRARLQ
ncbi:type II secretion system protein N [Halopseudomonas sp.]|uniref:type II secretion system protein N n=1 Tax=Halopseudomonas sp. TaxID=2901191 RepID=UPI0035671B0C